MVIKLLTQVRKQSSNSKMASVPFVFRLENSSGNSIRLQEKANKRDTHKNHLTVTVLVTNGSLLKKC